MSADEPTVPGLSRHRLSPKKLLLSKWTAVTPRDREKHFLVVRVVPPVPQGQQKSPVFRPGFLPILA
jgi:hypothetical protein